MTSKTTLFLIMFLSFVSPANASSYFSDCFSKYTKLSYFIGHSYIHNKAYKEVIDIQLKKNKTLTKDFKDFIKNSIKLAIFYKKVVRPHNKKNKQLSKKQLKKKYTYILGIANPIKKECKYRNVFPPSLKMKFNKKYRRL